MPHQRHLDGAVICRPVSQLSQYDEKNAFTFVRHTEATSLAVLTEGNQESKRDVVIAGA